MCTEAWNEPKQMILTVLKLRLLQFLRVLKEIGLIRIIILSLLFCIVPILAYHFLVPPKNTIKWLIVIGLLLLFIHSYRKDDHFLKIIINNPYLIYLSEYLLLTLPFFIIWLKHMGRCYWRKLPSISWIFPDSLLRKICSI